MIWIVVGLIVAAVWAFGSAAFLYWLVHSMED